MTHAQQRELEELIDRLRTKAGTFRVNGAPVSGASAANALACVSTTQMDALLEQIRTVYLIFEMLPDPNQVKPYNIPSRTSRPTIDIELDSDCWPSFDVHWK